MSTLIFSSGGSGRSQKIKAPCGLIFLVSAIRAPRFVSITTGQLALLLGYFRASFHCDVSKAIPPLLQLWSLTLVPEQVQIALSIQKSYHFEICKLLSWKGESLTTLDGLSNSYARIFSIRVCTHLPSFTEGSKTSAIALCASFLRVITWGFHRASRAG